LTELYNKRYLQEQLPVMLKNASEAGEPLCAAMFDIDGFKSYNDTFGHPAGDALLKQVARTMDEVLRECDTAVRFGGEEFLVVFAGADLEGGAAAAERIRAAVGRIDSANRPVTVSGGVAAFPEDAQDGDSLVECADRRLYEAKRAGKNRVLTN
jgi:diguanylate cyclase (GGDEF)-like protein